MMNSKHLHALAGASIYCLFAPQDALAQLRVASWNISFYDGSDRAAAIQTAVYGSYLGRSMSPDVLLVQEIENSSAITTLRNVLNAAPGSPGDWVAAPYLSGPDSVGGMLYRSSKVQFLGATVIAASDGSTADQPRNTERYDIRPVGYTAGAATLAMYCSHMKSGSASADNTRRLIESTRIRSNAEGLDTNPGNGLNDGLPAGWNFLLGGDFNMQSSSQTSYVELVGSQADNSGRFFDPINTPGSWNNNSSFRFVHTQDPIGAGGMDDRHDQILVSASLIDGQGLDYIGNPLLPYSTSTWNDPNHSYRSWGNDGSSYNFTMTVAGNTMVGPTIAQALIDACSPTGQSAGGHLPVFLDLRLPPEVTSTTVLNFGTVTQGASASLPLSVSNAGNTALFGATGIASLSYSLTASSGFTAPAGTFNDAAGGGLNSHTITMNTSTVGPRNGTITINSNAPDEPDRHVVVTGTVVANNTATNANAGPDQFLTDADNSGNEPVFLNGSGSFDAEGPIANYLWTEGATQLANSASPTANIVLPPGIHTITLTVTDSGGLIDTDTVVIDINRRPSAHAGPDQSVTDTDNSGVESVVLSGSGSDTDGTITSYTWHEGPTLIATGPSPTVGLPVGPHTLTLTVTDNDGATGTDIILVTVLPGCPADWNQDGSVDGDDVIAFFSQWDAGDADYNNDGGTDGDDVIGFFQNWDTGC